MRKVDWDEEGPLVWKKRYKSFRNRISKIGQMQNIDARIIQTAANYVGLPFVVLGQEVPDYIEDYVGPLTKNHKFRMQAVYFDFVMYCKETVIIFESDDRSHYDKKYCDDRGWDFEDIQRRDKIKDVWAEKTDTLLIRLPEHHLNADGSISNRITQKEKFETLTKIFKNIKEC